MNSYLPKKITDIKGKVALAELQRTHSIVFVLTLLVIVQLVTIAALIETNGFLVGAAVALLALLALMSLTTAIGLSKLIKK